MSETKKKALPAYVVLALIALVAALALAVTNAVTKGPIAEHQAAALREAYGEVMPAADYEQITEGLDGYDISSLYAAKDADGSVIGWCVTASKKGYGGQVAVTLGVDVSGKVTGCVVGDTSFAESAGFGSRAQEPEFEAQFEGLDAVQGGTFEKLSGATITSTAVLNAVTEALRCVAEVALKAEVTAEPYISFGAKAAAAVADPSSLTPGATMRGTAEGFGGGEVVVTYTLDDDCKIATVKIDASTQTAGFGQRCAEDEDYLNSFVGQSVPVTVDALAGATITSDAVLAAMNAAEPYEEVAGAMPELNVVTTSAEATLGTYGEDQAVVEPKEGVTGTVNVAVTVVDGKVTGISFLNADGSAKVAGEEQKANAPGFNNDPVIVYVAFYEDGTIASVRVNADSQQYGVGKVCEADSFTGQFLGKTGPFTLGEDIDACAGATFTSQGVVDAVNKLVKQQQAAAAPTEEPEATAEQKVSAPGYANDPVYVYVTLAEDGTIAALRVDASTQQYGIGKACEAESFTSQFVGKSGPFTLGDGIDLCAGATFTSQGVVDAVNKLFPAAAEPAEETTATDTEDADAEQKASAPGYNSDPVYVYVTLAEDGTVASLRVDASTQEYGVGKVCEAEDFTSQFIGKSGPFTLGEGIDACAGATFTSQGVVDAVNKVLAK